MNTCPICLDDVPAGSNKSCDCEYKFHDKCLRIWLKRQKTCPTCRRHIRPRPSRRARLIARLCEAQRRKERDNECEDSCEDSCEDVCEGYDLSPVSSDDDDPPMPAPYYDTTTCCKSCLHPFIVVGPSYRLCTGCGDRS